MNNGNKAYATKLESLAISEIYSETLSLIIIYLLKVIQEF